MIVIQSKRYRSLMWEKHVSFVEFGEKNHVVLASLIAEQTAAEIMRSCPYLQGAAGIAISTPNYVMRLGDNDRVLDLYPQLVLDNEPSEYERVDYGLVRIVNSEDLNQITLLIDVELMNGSGKMVPFRGMMVAFDLVDIKHVKDLIGVCQSGLGMSNAPVAIRMDGKVVEGVIDSQRLVTGSERIVFVSVIDEREMRNVERRIVVIGGMIDDEAKYIMSLGIIQHYWKPKIVNHKNLAPVVNATLELFNIIPDVIARHKEFLEGATKSLSGYATVIGDRMWELARRFGEDAKFAVMARDVLARIAKLDKKCKASLAKIGDTVETNRLGFEVYLKQLLERMEKYVLFADSLGKVTPQAHPDAPMIAMVEEMAEVSACEIDDTDKRAKHLELRNMRKNMAHDYEMARKDGARRIIFSASVNVKGRQADSTRIHLMNDIVCVVENVGGMYRVLADCNLQSFYYEEIHRGRIVIPAICCGDKRAAKACTTSFGEVEVTFEDDVSYRSFKRMWHKMRTKLRTRLVGMNYLRWSRRKQITPVPLAGFTFICESDGVWIIGEVPSMGSTAVLLNIDPVKNVTRSIPCPIAGRSMATSNTIDGKCYIVGGEIGGNEIDEVICYENTPSQHLWRRLFGADGTSMKPRACHTSVAYNGKLWIFGGRSGPKTFLNDVTVFSPTTQLFQTVQYLDDCVPAPRCRHSVCRVGHYMYIFGGIGADDVMFSDLWRFDLCRCEWHKIPLVKAPASVLRRCGHFAGTLDGSMIVFGGITTVRGNFPITINLDTGVVKCLYDTGPCPPYLDHACLCPRGDGSFLIAGGRKNMNKLSNCIHDMRIWGATRRVQTPKKLIVERDFDE